jgi:hypothetical protein
MTCAEAVCSVRAARQAKLGRFEMGETCEENLVGLGQRGRQIREGLERRNVLGGVDEYGLERHQDVFWGFQRVGGEERERAHM